MSVLRTLLIVPPIVAGAALLFFSASNREAPERTLPEESAAVARIVTVKPRTFVPRVTGFGTVEPARTWSAIAQVSARVTEVNPAFVRGGLVRKDEVLVRLAPEDFELSIAKSEANIESADAEIDEMELTRETTRLSLAIEKRSLELATTELKRQEQLVARGTVPQSSLDNQQTTVLAQEAKVQDLENRLTLFPAQIRALEQSKAVAQAELEIARLDLERTVIRAPFEGRVSEADVEISQFISSGTKMGSLDGIDAAEIDVQITPEQMAGFVRLVFGKTGRLNANQVEDMRPALSLLKASVRVGFTGGETVWDAAVKRGSDTADPQTRSIGVIVSVDRPYANLKPGERPPLIKGLFTEVELRGPPVDAVVLLPRSAIVGGRIRTVDAENRLRLKPVEIAYVFRDVAVLRNAPEAGLRVVVNDLSPAIEGMLLDPSDDLEADARLDRAARPEALVRAGTADR